MTETFTRQQVIADVSGLDPVRLVEFIEAEIIVPVHVPEQPEEVAFRQVDVARLRLACELCDCFEIRDETLAMVMGLVDQLHGARAELRAVVKAIETLPPDTQRDVVVALDQARKG
ncbi:chaperone modulator CbpM [Tropicimonas sp. TH_r6]|uniref:chaperone modulator CbpM n=1 Tax=Tropicimonas sp. TH_r6 TaxID=3082085 RepID=UPI002953B8E1|nr:chaperone modulator CbpM [Tropicimonas sp. TH_r6]MDV7143159.1 chaperone modulator CbpM [Tropicimonas sp. TH_r6]